VRSAAPIEGQLSFGVLLEEPVPAESSEPPEPISVEDVAPPASPRASPPASQPASPSPDAPPVSPTQRPDDAAERTLSPAGERTDPQDWHEILDFEREWTGSPGAKQRAVRDRFGIGSARYHQLLDRALERPEALVYDPGLVGRLRRLRDVRRRKRFAERLEVDPPADATSGRHVDRPTEPSIGPSTDPSLGQGGGGG
jgi:hypothetical protein